MAETPSVLSDGRQTEHTPYQGAGEVIFQGREALEREIADTKLLQDISSALIQEEDIHALYEKFMDAAAIIMQAPFASMQVLHAAPGGEERSSCATGGSAKRRRGSGNAQARIRAVPAAPPFATPPG